MPRVIECANLALVVYGALTMKNSHKLYSTADNYLNINWSPISSQIPSAPSINAPFYAELWLHHSKREAIVGFRGTEINVVENDIVDAKAWWSDALGEHKPERSPQYLKQAIWFTQDCKKYLAQHAPEAKLYFTGHSLGGAIAELMATKERDMSIAFNSPGIGHIKGVNTRLSTQGMVILIK